jgi:serine/threonine protein kinase
MHQLNLVHMDIKLENVMFSQTYSKFVFIDFGLSRFISESRGYKKKINFSGSLIYATPEMFESYRNSSMLELDVYYNDIHCLRETTSIMSKEMRIRSSCESQYSEEISDF